jgi:hypothetical protein
MENPTKIWMIWGYPHDLEHIITSYNFIYPMMICLVVGLKLFETASNVQNHLTRMLISIEEHSFIWWLSQQEP